MNSLQTVLIFALLGLILCLTPPDPTKDKTVLPSWEDYTHNVYSGLLEIVPKKRSIHYVFLESQNAPATDPVVLWLNGGPGCSSIVGMLQEIGPLVWMPGTAGFENNLQAWNLKANLLFFESPAGVGFSPITDPTYEYTDVNTGADNYAALVLWFQGFKTYAQRDFYIAGESYAGMYIPYTTKAVIDGNVAAVAADKINIKGILIGNGVLVMGKLRDDSGNKFYTQRNFINSYTSSVLSKQCVQFPTSYSCQQAETTMKNVLKEINPYGVYSYCWQDTTKAEFKQPQTSRFAYTPWLKGFDLGDPNAPCLDFGPTNNYFNLDTVKAALHVDTTKIFATCTELDYHKNPAGSYSLLPVIKAAGVKILIYSGDQDAAVSITETLDSLALLNLKEVTPWTPWGNKDKVVAGWTTEYDILTLNVVRAAGHMVPQDQRESALLMFNNWVLGEPLPSLEGDNQ